MAIEFLDLGISDLMQRSNEMTLAGPGAIVTYSRKVFIPLTRLCRDVCRYCTFATTPSDLPAPYLDLDAVMWLEDWLRRYPGALIVITHDRDFLDAVVDHIAHIDQRQLIVYRGNYSAFEDQRAERLLDLHQALRLLA